MMPAQLELPRHLGVHNIMKNVHILVTLTIGVAALSFFRHDYITSDTIATNPPLQQACISPAIKLTPQPDDTVLVEGDGTIIDSKIFDIGAEAPGLVIFDKTAGYALDFQLMPELQQITTGLAGRCVHITGRLKSFSGVERPPLGAIEVFSIR